MKKTVAVIGLLLIIALCSGFIWVKVESLGSENNYFNRKLRQRFDSYPTLRKIFGLHSYGDARADFLGTRYDQILVEVDLMQNEQFDLQILQSLGDKISTTTGKPVSYVISDRAIPYQKEVDAETIETLAEQYRNHFARDKTMVIYLLGLSSSVADNTLLGQTLREDGMILYADSISALVEENSALLGSYQISTALHEFGHLLGLEHNSQPGCLMNAEVEQGLLRWQSMEDVISNFCSFEFQQIQN